MADNPMIKQITLPSGTTYDIKDAWARERIAAMGDFTYWIGVTTTELTEGNTTNPITVNGQSVTALKGGIATYGSKEFAWNGSAWQEFGDLSGLGNMAFADTASASYTPGGSVTLTKTNKTATVSAAGSGEATYTPAGSVTLTKTNKTATVSAAGSGDATYTPAGSVSLSTTATAPTITASAGSSGSNTFQCSGSVAVSSAGSTDTVKSATKKTVALSVDAAAPGATAPSNAITYYSVSGETLSLYQLGYTTGDSITETSKTVKTGDASYSFTGGYVTLANSSINVPTSASFTGTGARLVTGNISTADSASFSGTGVRLETGSISTTDSASFSGTAATIQVTPDSNS